MIKRTLFARRILMAAMMLSSLVVVAGVIGCSPTSSLKEDVEVDYTALVYPFLDTEHSRWFFFSSASRPFGMVNLSPDTDIDGAWNSGYHVSSDTVKGFSHVHAWQLSALSVVPVTLSDEKAKGDIYDDFYSPFSHQSEVVRPGYHKLHLDRYDIGVELTSTKRVGFHKYNYPKDGTAALLLNLNTVLGPADNIDGQVVSSDKKSISGEVSCAATFRRPRPVRIHFELSFDSEIASLERDKRSGNYLVTFAGSDRQVKMKAAISYTSLENAKRNMASELAGWDFEQVVEASRMEWNSMLSRIKIETSDSIAKRRFYTDLWHALQGRRTISDVNGNYPDNTGEEFRIGEIPLGEDGKPLFNHYNSDSFWGAQWTINTLWQLAYPEIADEFVGSMLTYYRDGGMIPRGPSGGNYTYVMTGAASTPFIVAAYQKGIRGFDVELAYEGLRKNHMLENGMMQRAGYEHNSRSGGGLKYYIEQGYVPYPNPDGDAHGSHRNGPAQTLEYAYQDWTLAQLAKALGKDDDYKLFMARSQNYKNLYDKESTWMRPKDVNGKWRKNFDPYEYVTGFTESNAAQTTWFVPHDLGGLAELMGGKELAIAKLNEQFEQASQLGFTSGTSHAQETHQEYRRIPINYGNQPSIQTAFIFNHLEAPELTQYWSRQVALKVFSELATDRGYCGDEDQGLMGSLAILYKIGLFQMDGGTSLEPYYELGSPLYDRVEIVLNPDYYKGEKFVITTVNNSVDNCYIKSARLNGERVEGFKIPHSEIVNGAELVVEMGGK